MYIYFVFLEEIGSLNEILGELGELSVVPYKFRKLKDKYSFDHPQVFSKVYRLDGTILLKIYIDRYLKKRCCSRAY